MNESPIARAPLAAHRPSGLMLWISAARPATLLAGVAPVLLGVAFAVQARAFEPVAAFFALLVAVFIQIGTNFANDYFDFKKGADTDARLGPARVVQKGWVEPKAVAIAAALMFGLAFLCGLVLVAKAGWVLLLVGIASIISGVMYTGTRYALAYNGLGDLFVLVFFGPVAVVGTYYVQAKQLDWAPFVGSLTIGFLATAVLVVNNLRDRFTDAAVDKKTLVVRFGHAFGLAEHAFTILAPFVIVLAGVAFQLFPLNTLVTLILLPLAVREVQAVRALDGADLNPHLGGAAKLCALFAFVFSFPLFLA